MLLASCVLDIVREQQLYWLLMRWSSCASPGTWYEYTNACCAAGMLVEAAVTDDVQLYERALAAGADPAQAFSNGSSAFMIAAANGSINVLRLIYERAPQLLNAHAGAHAGASLITLAWPLRLAIAHQEVLLQLLDWGAVCCSFKQNEAQDESVYPEVGCE
jgi:hypothetical protein